MSQAEFHELAELTHHTPAHPVVIYGTLLMVLSLLFSMLAFLPLGGLVGHRAGFYEPGSTATTLVYQQNRLAVGGELEREQARALVPVARSAEGVYLFAPEAAAGGGGGAAVIDAPLSRYGKLYVKTQDGRFLALTPAR